MNRLAWCTCVKVATVKQARQDRELCALQFRLWDLMTDVLFTGAVQTTGGETWLGVGMQWCRNTVAHRTISTGVTELYKITSLSIYSVCWVLWVFPVFSLMKNKNVLYITLMCRYVLLCQFPSYMNVCQLSWCTYTTYFSSLCFTSNSIVSRTKAKTSESPVLNITFALFWVENV